MAKHLHEALGRSLRRDLFDAFSRPWLLMLAAITTFVALEGNLGRMFGPSADELRIPDSIMMAKRDPNLVDHEAAARLDDFLRQHDWVEEIVH